MKFKNYLTQIDDVSIYPLITLVLFVGIFILATILIFAKDKKTIEHIKNIPLED